MPETNLEECDYSGLAKMFCAHCKGDTLGDERTGPATVSETSDTFVRRSLATSNSAFDRAAAARGPVEREELDEDDANSYEIVGRVFQAVYRGRCTINSEHVIKPNTRVAKVQHVGNPFIVVPGVACAACIRQLPRER